MLIAVLGANSFSGASFVAHAARAGHEVMPLQRPHHDLNTRLEAIVEAVRENQPDVFVNFAALNMVAESWAHFQDYYQTNVIGIARLADCLRNLGLKRFVQVSTPEVYGNTAGEERPLAEGAPFAPSTPYAVSRAAADMHLRALHRLHGFPVCFTRSVNVYGPGQQPYRLIPKTVLSILRGEKLPLDGGGRSCRAFIHARDMAAAILAVAERGRPGEDYHIATGYEIAIREVVKRVCELMGARFQDAVHEVSERPGKDRAYRLDDRKIRNELGWQESVPFQAGLTETVAWFRARADHRSLAYEHRP